MSRDYPTTPLTARRQLSFLSTFEKKFTGFMREMERLRRAGATGKAFGGRWPTEGLERTARSLIGAGAVYNLPEITEWARGFLGKLDTIRISKEPPGAEELAWLGNQIGKLEDLKVASEKEALAIVDPTPGGEKKVTDSSEQPERIELAAIPPHISTEEIFEDAWEATSVIETPAHKPPVSGVHETIEEGILSVQLEEPTKTESTTRDNEAVAETASTDKPIDVSDVPVDWIEAPIESASEVESVPLARATIPPEQATNLVLVAIDQAGLAGQVEFFLKNAGFGVKKIQLMKNAAFEAAAVSPELIIVDMDEPAPAGSTVVDALARDPLTDFIPILRIGTAKGLSRPNFLTKPIDSERLLTEARRLAAPDIHSFRIATGLRDPNLIELVAFVTEEINAGVLDSVSGTHINDRFRLISEGRLVASLWSLIAQIRKAAALGSNGRVKFTPAASGQLGMMALAEAEEVLETDGYTDPDEDDLVHLKELRVVVADDDPEIRRVFETVLGEVGMVVDTASDGIEALNKIRDLHPSLIISDIVMPGMDGWELCNRLRADYLLKHIPVILLSWKEDFLERLKGLNVSADGFMLKEVDKKQILGRVVRVLKRRFALRNQLRVLGDIHGRIESVGALTILSTALEMRPDCRISFREAWNYFEADIIGGELAAVTRTGSDGTFSSGEAALERLLGTASGRFTVTEAIDTQKRHFMESGTRGAINEACRKLNYMVAQIIDGALLDIENIETDPDVIKLYQQIMPQKLKPALAKLIAGTSPMDIILAQELSPDAAEVLLLDLVRVGGIITINSPPPDLTRTPVARISTKWKAMGTGQVVEEDKAPSVPISQMSDLKEPTSDIPLTLDEISVIAPIGTSNLDLELESSSPAKKHGNLTWKIATMGALLLFCLSALINIYWFRASGNPYHEDTFEPSSKSSGKEKETNPVETVKPEATKNAAISQLSSETISTTPSNNVEEISLDKAVAPNGKSKKSHLSQPGSGDLKNPGETTPTKEIEEKATTDENIVFDQKPEKQEVTGTLAIILPQGVDESIRVSVDGRLRGIAPLKIELAPGLHDIVFSLEGKRKLRAVSIRAGSTKKITAMVPK